MSILSKLDEWLLKKVSKGKVKHLFMVPKNILFDRIRELNDYADQLSYKNELLEDSNKELRERLNKQEINKSIISEVATLEKDLQQMKEQNKLNKTELAYQSLVKKYEELQQENKSIKGTLDVAYTALKNTNKQNDILREKFKSFACESKHLQEHDSEHLLEKNNDLKEKTIKVVKHNFTKKENANSNNRSKGMMITRQVNN